MNVPILSLGRLLLVCRGPENVSRLVSTWVNQTVFGCQIIYNFLEKPKNTCSMKIWWCNHDQDHLNIVGQSNGWRNNPWKAILKLLKQIIKFPAQQGIKLSSNHEQRTSASPGIVWISIITVVKIAKFPFITVLEVPASMMIHCIKVVMSLLTTQSSSVVAFGTSLRLLSAERVFVFVFLHHNSSLSLNHQLRASPVLASSPQSTVSSSNKPVIITPITCVLTSTPQPSFPTVSKMTLWPKWHFVSREKPACTHSEKNPVHPPRGIGSAVW